MLDRYSPAIPTMNMNVLLQIPVNHSLSICLGDLRNVFCQSAPLRRERGEFYFEAPKEGIDPRQLILIVNGWRKSLVGTLQELGYVQSKMDLYLFRFHQHGCLAGLVAIKMDDLLRAEDLPIRQIGGFEESRKRSQLQWAPIEARRRFHHPNGYAKNC